MPLKFLKINFILFFLSTLFTSKIIAQVKDSILYLGFVKEDTYLYDKADFKGAAEILKLAVGDIFYVVEVKIDPIGSPFRSWYHVRFNDTSGYIPDARFFVCVETKSYLVSKKGVGLETRKKIVDYALRMPATTREYRNAALQKLLTELKSKGIKVSNEINLSWLENTESNVRSRTEQYDEGQCNDLQIKKIAIERYPNDKSMQEFIFKVQMSSCNFMKQVSDFEIRQISQDRYPNDFQMQKFTYDQQLSAKTYMKSVNNTALKLRVEKEYPRDYVMQKYLYDKEAY